MVGVAIGVRERLNVLLHVPGCDVVPCGLSRRVYDTTGCTPLIPPGCSPSREPAHRCKDRKKVIQAAEELRAHHLPLALILTVLSQILSYRGDLSSWSGDF